MDVSSTCEIAVITCAAANTTETPRHMGGIAFLCSRAVFAYQQTFRAGIGGFLGIEAEVGLTLVVY